MKLVQYTQERWIDDDTDPAAWTDVVKVSVIAQTPPLTVGDKLKRREVALQKDRGDVIDRHVKSLEIVAVHGAHVMVVIGDEPRVLKADHVINHFEKVTP
jgi:hypothetical protein